MSTLRKLVPRPALAKGFGVLLLVLGVWPSMAHAQTVTPTPTPTATVTVTPTPTVTPTVTPTPTPVATAVADRNLTCAWFQPTSAASQTVVFKRPLHGPFALHVTEVGTLSFTVLVRLTALDTFATVGPAITASVAGPLVPIPARTPHPEEPPDIMDAVRITTGTCTGCSGSVISICGRSN